MNEIGLYKDIIHDINFLVLFFKAILQFLEKKFLT